GGVGMRLDDLLEADSLAADAVYLMEAHVLPSGSRIQADRDPHQAEADRPRPYRTRHRLIMAWLRSAGYRRRRSNAERLTRRTGPEVGGAAHRGPFVRFRAPGPGGLFGGLERGGAEQQAQRRLVEAGDPDDELGGPGRVSPLPAVGRAT